MIYTLFVRTSHINYVGALLCEAKKNLGKKKVLENYLGYLLHMRNSINGASLLPQSSIKTSDTVFALI